MHMNYFLHDGAQPTVATLSIYAPRTTLEGQHSSILVMSEKNHCCKILAD